MKYLLSLSLVLCAFTWGQAQGEIYELKQKNDGTLSQRELYDKYNALFELYYEQGLLVDAKNSLEKAISELILLENKTGVDSLDIARDYNTLYNLEGDTVLYPTKIRSCLQNK